MNQGSAQPENLSITPKKLRLYIYGSCESDQYYHPSGQSESKRPICLTDIENFNIEDEEAEQDNQHRIIPNPLFKIQIYKIACGALHTIVLTTEGAVYTFGCNDEGALGRQGLEKIPAKVEISDPIDLISAGDNHSVFANSMIGSFYFTGTYKYMRGESMGGKTTGPERFDVAQLDARLKNQPIQKVVSGSNHSAILVGGKIFIRGEPEAHTVGRRINERHKVKSSLTFDGVGLNKVEDLWCGGYHSIAKVKKGSTWHYFAWGLNKHGQLGLGTYEDSPYPQELNKFKGVNIVDVAAGTNFTILLTQDGELYGCGQNDDGQLGLGEDYIYQDSEQSNQDRGDELENQIQNKMNLKEEQKHNEDKVPQQKNQSENKRIQQNPQQKNKQGSLQRPEEGVKNQEEQQVNKQAENNISTEKLEAPQTQKQQVQMEQHVQVQKDEPTEKKDTEEKHLDVKGHQSVEKQMEIEEVAEVRHKMKEENIYIKSFRKITIDQKLSRIQAGSEFCFGWNQDSLYSWGFGSNYVLLNGQEDDELTPFKVKPRIINEHAIYDLAAGAQHVAFLSYPTSEQKPTPKLSQEALEHSRVAKQKLSKKKRV